MIVGFLELVIEVALSTTTLIEHIDDIAKPVVLHKLVGEFLLDCHRLAVARGILMLYD